MIRLFVIEDHASIIVAGLKRLFYGARDGIEVTGFAADVETAGIQADPATFDMFILDLWLENRDPVSNFRRLIKQFSDKPILIYTSESSLAWKNRMLTEGAMAWILKSATRKDIKIAIENVSRGVAWFPANLAQLTTEKRLIMETGGKLPLTPVEKEILRLLKEGMTHKEVATQLGKSHSSIDKTLAKLRAQFGVESNIQLLLKSESKPD